MNDITTVDPEEILKTTKAQFFMIVWTSSKGSIFCISGGNLQNAINGPMNSPVIERRNAGEEYTNLVKKAKSDEQITDGRIDCLVLKKVDNFFD